MEVFIKSGSPEKQRTACVVVGVFEPRRLSPAARDIDRATDGYLTKLLRRGDLEGRQGQFLMLHNLPNILPDRVLLVGMGKERDLDDKRYRETVEALVKHLDGTGSMEAVVYFPELHVKGREIEWKVRAATESGALALYRFDQYKSKTDKPRRPLRRLTFCVPRRSDLRDGQVAVDRGLAYANGVMEARDLANQPPNVATPAYLAEHAEELAKEWDLGLTVLDEKQLEKEGMGAFLAVGKGSVNPPRLMAMEYQGGAKGDKPYVLVGKGISFDSGGISIKPAAAMDEMKYDMCGAAGVFGIMRTIAELQLPINVVGVAAAAENLPDGQAYRPGDILTSKSGQTIEVINTDAEGRLVLADALTWIQRYDPRVVIDMATLTGACLVALGKNAAGLMGNNDRLVRELMDAGDETGERGWQLPLWDDYQEQLKSNFADMKNVGGREAGTITAGCFLSRFTEDYEWAHVDIAGVAWKSGDDKSATGHPVRMISQYLVERAAG
ncbi:aminopeptidase [Thiohalorhabdus denitrificans]|uniref:Probable cytosol aminopeptidase n=1 Tax=Thiohalorhabdus denitrificans TaxID=381306 RepID=A0A0P9CUV5_9GAMM|nr:leucyl aminopeptidase [Thiohalorhabdus denitrificans]KPV40450.1 aminopeptidase [Thiohalorhabdus denitrificans]SCY61170.1 leucyl aminopeptidase [Thiohalorhabdus denitrificans]